MSKILKPPASKASSVIGVVAPASPVRREFVEKGLDELVRLGFRPRVSDRLYERDKYTAGDVRARVSDLHDLWDDPEIEAIFCARGGYGSLQMLEYLEPSRFRDRPIAFIGSSDITVLLCYLVDRAGIVGFHGPMVAQQIARGEAAYDRASLTGMLGRSEPWGRLQVGGTRLLHSGAGEGTLTGGCLSLIAALVGTPYQPNFEDTVLLLEDTAVRPYQIDRMMTQLRLSGCLNGVRGLIFGQMPDCDQHPEQGYTIDGLLKELTEGMGVPVMFGFPSGHTISPAWTIPFGVRARLDSEGLSLLEGAVS
jgi:muramoyltetrapeptide carboxypeptidase